MTKIFLLALGIFAINLLGMSIGFILKGRTIKGSCGGMADVLGEDCFFCEKRDKCPNKA